jgi:hypothetical protein
MTDLPFSPLVGAILEQGAAITASITNAAVDSLQHENKTLKATLYLIRDRIDDLAHGPMTPMLGRDMLAALEPDEIDVRQYINRHLEG